jgi:hypothetical protein
MKISRLSDESIRLNGGLARLTACQEAGKPREADGSAIGSMLDVD